MRIDRHAIDETYMKDLIRRFGENVEELTSYLDSAKRDPKNLSLLIGRAYATMAYGCVVEPESPHITSALRLAADAHVALFAAAMGIEVRLDEFGVVGYSSLPDESTLHVGRWIEGFAFNVICSKLSSIKLLCQVPLELVQKSSTQAPEYEFLHMESLRMFGQAETNGLVRNMLAAVSATNPKRTDIIDPDWTLYIDVPQLEVFIYMVTKDQKFEGALIKALKLHKKYWSKSKDRRRDYQGFISIELTSLAALGRRRGLTFDIDSPYLPMHLADLG